MFQIRISASRELKSTVLRRMSVTVRRPGVGRFVTFFTAVACAMTAFLTGCSSRSSGSSGSATVGSSSNSPCNSCSRPPPQVDVSVSATLNGTAENQPIAVRPGADIALAVTMIVGKSAVVSALRVGLIDSQEHGLPVCGVLTWVLQRPTKMGPGRYHFETDFVVQPVRDHDIQPMSVIAYIDTSTPPAGVAPIIGTYKIAPITPATESTEPLATPPCQ